MMIKRIWQNLAFLIAHIAMIPAHIKNRWAEHKRYREWLRRQEIVNNVVRPDYWEEDDEN